VGWLVQRLAGQEQVFERGNVVLPEIGWILFFNTRIPVGEEKHHPHLWSCTIFHQIPGSGRMGRPSYTMVVIPRISGAYTM